MIVYYILLSSNFDLLGLNGNQNIQKGHLIHNLYYKKDDSHFKNEIDIIFPYG